MSSWHRVAETCPAVDKAVDTARESINDDYDDIIKSVTNMKESLTRYIEDLRDDVKNNGTIKLRHELDNVVAELEDAKSEITRLEQELETAEKRIKELEDEL